MANKEPEHKEHEHVAKKATKDPELFTADQVLRLVTETIHEMKPQPDPATIKDVLAAMQARLHGDK